MTAASRLSVATVSYGGSNTPRGETEPFQMQIGNDSKRCSCEQPEIGEEHYVCDRNL
jgi:hypothetical protein